MKITYASIWHDAEMKPATADDADCEGCVWVWREMFAADADKLRSTGFHMDRVPWREVGMGRSDRSGVKWTQSNLAQPIQPS